MKVEDVPQDGINADKDLTEVQYALDKDGNIVPVRSNGWFAKSVVMEHAWNTEVEKIEQAKLQVEKGVKSPLYFHMLRNFMNVKILAAYTGFSRLAVRRHFKPSVFNALSEQKLSKYVEAFSLESINGLHDLTIDKLKKE